MNSFRHIILFVITLLLGIEVKAQSSASDSLYALGVALYNVGKYEEAIPYFSQSRDLDLVELDSLSPRREYSTQWLASCYHKLGNISKAKELYPVPSLSEPVDRRQTSSIDSIIAIANVKRNNQNYSEALTLYKTVSELEHALYNDNHCIHTGTAFNIAFAYVNLSHIDSALVYFYETRRIYDLNFSSTDTTLIILNNSIFYCELAAYDYEAARETNDRIQSIVNANFPDTHIENVEIAYRHLLTYIYQRNWDKVDYYLPRYIKTIKYCIGNDYTRMCNCITNIANILSQAGRTDNVAQLNKELHKLTKHLNTQDNIESLLLLYARAISNFKKSESKSFERQITEILEKNPSDSLKRERAYFKCVKVMQCLFLENDTTKAKDLFIDLQNDSLDVNFINDDIYSLYTITKSLMSMMLFDYGNAISGYEELIKIHSNNKNINTLDLQGLLAYLYAMNGDYHKSKTMASETINAFRDMSNSNNLDYRLDVQLNKIDRLINLGKTYNQYQSLPDSARYALNYIKTEFLQLKSELLKQKYADQTLINADYYRCINRYTYTLAYSMNDKVKAIEVLKNYYSDLQNYCLNNNDTQGDTNWQYQFGCEYYRKSILADLVRLYEKNDPEGIKAHMQYLNYLSDNYGETDSRYIDAKIAYYQYTDNTDSLTKYLTSLPNKSTEQWDMLININQSIDSESYLNILKERLKDAIDTSKKEKESSYPNWYYTGSLANVISEYINRKDTVSLIAYYQNELLPLLKEEDNKTYFSLLLSSIQALNFKLKNIETFNEMIKTEMASKPKVFQGHLNKSLINQAQAIFLISNRNYKAALPYIRTAYQETPIGTAEHFLFACDLFEVMSHIHDDEIPTDTLLAFGKNLLNSFDKNPKYKLTGEYYNFVNTYTQFLNNQGLHQDIINIINPIDIIYTNYKDNPWSYDQHLYLYIENWPKWTSNISINTDLKITTLDNLRERLFDSQIKSNAITIDNAEKILSNYFRHQFMSIEDVINNSDYLTNVYCDDYISTTSNFAYKFNTIDVLGQKAYDASLYCKGLQLRSDFEFRSMIANSKNKSAIRMFDEIRAIEKLLPNATQHQFDSLRAKKNSIESDLRRISNSFGDYKNNLLCTWKDIQQNLKKHDIAVEFTYVDEENEMDGYYACVLTHDKSPKVVFVTHKDSVDITQNVYKSSYLSDKILKALQPYLAEVKNIYFSPIRALNQVSIENLPLKEDSSKTLSHKYNLYRLSSTRELIKKQFEITGSNAIIYGGINYNTSVQDICEETQKYPGIKSRATNIDVTRWSMEIIPFLEGTQIEATEIASTINNKQDSLLHATPMMGNAGTETSFKALSGKKTRIGHIATHGFYLQPNETSHIQTLKTRGASQEENALMRSGLFFAGADNLFLGYELPDNVDDGILTSYEISNIDLTGMELVVLSACQTALGYTTSEGVFGLQRGFKKAGVKSILMSLWKVDDEATCFLMTEFYKNWMDGNTKHDALELAKNAVRSHEKWKEPKYWAAFILLDAVD